MTRTNRWLLFFLVLAVAVTLRFWRITSLPPGFYLDEAYEGIEAWRILTEPGYHPLYLPVNSAGVLPLNAYANAAMFALFRLFGGEVGPVAMRTTAACFGVLAVGALYGLGDEIQRRTRLKLSTAFPFFAAAMLAVMRWHFHFNRIGIETSIGPMLWAGALWLLLRGWRTDHWLNFAGCGVLLAASIYTYQAAWIMPLLSVPVALLLLAEDAQIAEAVALPQANAPARLTRWLHSKPAQLKGLFVAALVAFLLVLPFGWHLWHHPEILTARASEAVSIGGTDRNVQPSVWRSVRQTFMMYIPLDQFGDLNVQHNIPGEPVLNSWQAILFFIGLGLAIKRIRQPMYAIILLSLVGLLLPGAPTKHAPAYHRLLSASVPTALLCAIAVDWFWQWRWWTNGVGRSSLIVQHSIRWAGVLLLVLGGATAAYQYFVVWAALPQLYYAFDAGLWEVSQQIAKTPPTMPIYITPKQATDPTLTFPLLIQQHPMPVSFDGREVFPLTAAVTAQPELYVVIEHTDFRTRLLLPEVFPTAKIQQEWLDRTGEVYARYYVRPAGAVPQRAPQHKLAVTLGDGIALAGYDVQPKDLHPGKILYLQFHWLVQAKPTADWAVIMQVVARDATGKQQVVTALEGKPGDESLLTTRWQAGWRILDEYQIHLPDDLAPSKYVLQFRLTQADGTHLPSGDTYIELGKVKVK